MPNDLMDFSPFEFLSREVTGGNENIYLKNGFRMDGIERSAVFYRLRYRQIINIKVRPQIIKQRFNLLPDYIRDYVHVRTRAIFAMYRAGNRTDNNIFDTN